MTFLPLFPLPFGGVYPLHASGAVRAVFPPVGFGDKERPADSAAFPASPAQEGGCTLDAMCEVMNEIKKDELDHVTIKNEVLRKYFPKSYTPKQMQDTIIRLLEKLSLIHIWNRFPSVSRRAVFQRMNMNISQEKNSPAVIQNESA